jgi:hypothetical protein
MAGKIEKQPAVLPVAEVFI